MRLNNKAVLITGAKGGLGNYVTNAFLDEGARVVGVARSIADSDFPHPNFSAQQVEISGGAVAGELVQSVLAKLGKIDVLVHLVGGFAGEQRVDETDDATVERMFDINFRSAFHMMKAVLPGMRAAGHGHILAIGSRAAVEQQPSLGAYGASKAALVSLIRTVALENNSCNISANVILPSTMDTPANRSFNPGADYSKWVQPTEVASLLVHLAQSQPGQISGAVIPIYGGEL